MCYKAGAWDWDSQPWACNHSFRVQLVFHAIHSPPTAPCSILCNKRQTNSHKRRFCKPFRAVLNLCKHTHLALDCPLRCWAGRGHEWFVLWELWGRRWTAWLPRPSGTWRCRYWTTPWSCDTNTRSSKVSVYLTRARVHQGVLQVSCMD